MRLSVADGWAAVKGLGGYGVAEAAGMIDGVGLLQAALAAAVATVVGFVLKRGLDYIVKQIRK